MLLWKLSLVVHPGIGFLEQRHEHGFERFQVLVHALGLVAADETTHGGQAEQGRGIEHFAHEHELLLANRPVVVQQVVEIDQIADADLGFPDCRFYAVAARGVERRTQVQGVGNRIQHGLRRHVTLGWMQSRRELNHVSAHLTRKVQPIFNRAIGIGIANIARCELLQGGGEDAELHELGFEVPYGHGQSPGTSSQCGATSIRLSLRLNFGLAGNPRRFAKSPHDAILQPRLYPEKSAQSVFQLSNLTHRLLVAIVPEPSVVRCRGRERPISENLPHS
jgi:hypothetical protein